MCFAKMIHKVAKKFDNFIFRMDTKVIKNNLIYCGKNVSIGKGSSITANTVSIGNNVSLGVNTLIMSTRARVIIGDDVMFGPGVTIITGNHTINLVGRTMKSVTDNEKNPDDDQDVTIENDVWVGANATLLKGITIGTGSVIAAGSVVTKDIPPYQIWGGVPARFIKERFSEEELKNHIEMLQLPAK